MVGQSRRKRRATQLLGSHQRCWVWGRHAVREILLAGRWRPLELCLADRLSPEEIAEVRRFASDLDTRLTVESADELTRRCRTAEHQGYLAKMPPFPYDDLESLLSGVPAAPALVLLDAVQDPFNFGAIIRSADVLGMDGLIVGRSHQAEVSSLVARSSAGAVNHVRMAQADDLLAAADRLRAERYRLIGASEKSDKLLHACDFRGPVVIVMGNEGEGIRPELLQRCDDLVKIPQQGHVASLNAAVAAGILFYEAQRQRRS